MAPILRPFRAEDAASVYWPIHHPITHEGSPPRGRPLGLLQHSRQTDEFSPFGKVHRVETTRYTGNPNGPAAAAAVAPPPPRHPSSDSPVVQRTLITTRSCLAATGKTPLFAKRPQDIGRRNTLSGVRVSAENAWISRP